MVFSSVIFLFLFLPIAIIGYFVMTKKLRNAFLVLVSLIFYAWGEPSFALVIILATLINYVMAIIIGRTIKNNKKLAKFYLGVAIFINLGILIFFKYINFILQNIINISSYLKIQTHLILPDIALPLGISFFTFHSLSYCIDVYRRDVTPQKNVINTLLYTAFFPQLIAGPIVRYKDISKQIVNRKINFNIFSEGVRRFISGLAKKVLIADTVGYLADNIFTINIENLNSPLAWLAIIAYSLQIYFDFSGYSDMAIGLAKMFGFDFLENFNQPYISKSIKEFWTRWHISLSRWFKDYLYIPLGGNRHGIFKTYRNLLIVFFITGLWHGANWTFVIWGLWHGLFLILERSNLNKYLEKIPSFFQHIYALLVVVIGWVFFRLETVNQSFLFLKKMFFFWEINGSNQSISFFIDPWIITFLLIGLVMSVKSFNFKMSSKISILVYTTIFILSIITISGGAYHPFIYFKF